MSSYTLHPLIENCRLTAIVRGPIETTCSVRRFGDDGVLVEFFNATKILDFHPGTTFLLDGLRLGGFALTATPVFDPVKGAWRTTCSGRFAAGKSAADFWDATV